MKNLPYYLSVLFIVAICFILFYVGFNKQLKEKNKVKQNDSLLIHVYASYPDILDRCFTVFDTINKDSLTYIPLQYEQFTNYKEIYVHIHTVDSNKVFTSIPVDIEKVVIFPRKGFQFIGFKSPKLKERRR